MQTCQNCLLQHYNGTIFCDNCGANLLPPATPPRPSLLYDSTADSMATDGGDDSSDDGGETTRTVSPTVESQHTGLLVQLVLHDGQHVKLIPDMHLVIGRRGKSKKNNCHAPDVDLEPYDGYDAGVSRQHALLAWRDDSYVLEDLKSLNGTFVNGTRLSPGEAVAIHDGDYVQFGTLQAQVQVGGAQIATSTSMRAA